MISLDTRKAAVQNEATGPLQNDINRLQVQLEQQQTRQKELASSRDLALTNYHTLQNKLDEEEIAAKTPDSIIRMGAPVAAPQNPTLNVFTTFGTFTLLGLALGLGCAFVIEAARPPREPQTADKTSTLTFEVDQRDKVATVAATTGRIDGNGTNGESSTSQKAH